MALQSKPALFFQMEAERKRKALADCTNTTSYSIEKHFVASAIKKIIKDTSGQSVNKSKSDSGFTSCGSNENNGEIAIANPSSTAVKKSSRLSGTAGKLDVVEPCSVYNRRRTADERKRKGKAVDLPLSGSPAMSFKTDGDRKKEDKDPALSKSFAEPRKKKKKKDSQHDVPPDFIERQRAYFAEIDAFELSEEEVESIDQLE